VAAEVIKQLKNKPVSVETLHDADLHNFFLNQENRQSCIHDFGDTPQILVGDNDSVCYLVVDDTVRPTKTTNLMDQEKKNKMIREQKAKWDMWIMMKGNAILPREVLENCIMTNLLCLSSIKNQLQCKNWQAKSI